MRDMSSRLATKRVRRPASSSIEASRSPRCCALIPSPNLRSVVTAPVIAASGVRRSCDSDASSVLRSFSFSSSATVRTESSTRIARSVAIAACSRIRLSACSSVGEIDASRFAGAKPQTPTTPREVTSGRNWKRTLGKVPVRQPAASPFSNAQRAALVSPALSASTGGQAALSASSPSSGRSITTLSASSVRCAWTVAVSRMSANATAPDNLRENSKSERVACAFSRASRS